MKNTRKIFAMILVVAMMSTMAFAASAAAGDILPGEKLEFTIETGGDLLTRTAGVITNANKAAWANTDYDSKNMSITTVKWTKGSDLVKSMYVDDGTLVIQLKDNFTLVGDRKALAGSFKIVQRQGKTNSYVLADVTVGYAKDEVLLDTEISISAAADTVYAFEKGVASYGTAFFSDAMGNDVEVRVYAGESFYLASNSTPNLDIVKRYDDTNAVLEFVSFPANPTFSSSATYYIFAEKDEFIYTVKNGALAASGAKWDNDEGCWILKTRTLGSYVISDIKLNAAAGGTTGTGIIPNPDTGANDIVGIAGALAAVALISAAAISLKK